MNDYDDFEDDDNGDRMFGLVRTVAMGAALVAAAGLVWFGVVPLVAGDGSEGETLETANATVPPDDLDVEGAPATSDSADDAEDDAQDSGDQGPTTDAPVPTTGGEPAATDEPTMDEPASTEASTSTSEPPTDDVVAAPSSTIEAAPDVTTVTPSSPVDTSDSADATRSYETLPDGSPVPVRAIYDGPLITLSGTVPSEAAADRLRLLALANSTDPTAEVASFLVVDPTVPIGVGVRVIEMNSPRFPEGSPSITPEHGAQLDRVSAVMTALPNVTVVVVGHADQRGDDETNRELSTARARAAADYLTSQGVDPTRLSSRGAGESDLLSLNDDDASLALNRRTEFVFFGLLVDAEST